MSELFPNVYHCYRQGRYPVTFEQLPEIKWELVGVYELGGIGNETVELKKDKITGKVLKVGNFLITCPRNILREK